MRTWILFLTALVLVGIALFPGFSSPAGPVDDLAGMFLAGGRFTVFLVVAALAAFAVAASRKSRATLLATFIIALCYLLTIALFNTAMPPQARNLQTWHLDPGPRVLLSETYLGPEGHGLGYRTQFEMGGGSFSAYHEAVRKVDWSRWALWISVGYGLPLLLIGIYRTRSRQLPAPPLRAFEVVIPAAREPLNESQPPVKT